MTKVALRGLAQRKLRAFVTMLAVLLGVAFIAGSYVLTDTINRSFDDIFDDAYAGTDVAISPSTTGGGEGIDLPPFSAEVLNQVRRVDGVEKAAGGIFSTVRFVDEEGEPLSAGFAPEFVSSVAPEPFETLTYTDGRPPENADEASIDESTADREDFGIGDTLRIAGPAGVKGDEIVGLQRLGSTSSGGSSTAQLTLEEAQRLTDKQGEFDGISVEAEEGVSPGELANRIDQVLPARLTVETGIQAAERQSEDIKEDLSFFRIVLLVFGGVALLVGSFLNFNTFGIDLPNTGTVIAARTVALALVVGMAVTFAAALSPALRATRVSPMAALLEAALPESRTHGRVFTAVAVLLMLGGLALTCLGLFGGLDSNAAAGAVGGGAVAILFGVSMFSPRLVRPLASVAGWPLEKVRGITGRLARENAVRKPGRTAVTAAALMIGLAVVGFVTGFAAGISSSNGNAIDPNFQGDVVLPNVGGLS